jgi:hypothetical protein
MLAGDVHDSNSGLQNITLDIGEAINGTYEVTIPVRSENDVPLKEHVQTVKALIENQYALSKKIAASLWNNFNGIGVSRRL